MRRTRNFLFGLLVVSPVASLKRSHSAGSPRAARFSFLDFAFVVLVFVLMTALLVGRWVHVALHARALGSRGGLALRDGARRRSGRQRLRLAKHARSMARGSLDTKLKRPSAASQGCTSTRSSAVTPPARSRSSSSRMYCPSWSGS